MNGHGRVEAKDGRGADPLVSFIILTFNQVAYIEEAVEGALAQDYDNLEIIVSDDGSTDGTWELLQQLAERHDRLRINRTETNKGTVSHLYEAVRLSEGELLVLGAGDDVSRPIRISRVVEEWRGSGASAIQSNASVIDERSAEIAPLFQKDPHEDRLTRYFYHSSAFVVLGSTSAYTRDVFDNIHEPNERILSEDAYFSLLCSLRGKTCLYIKEPLVKYRASSTSLTHRPSSLEIDEIRRHERRDAQMMSATLVSLLTRFRQVAVSETGVNRQWGEPHAVNLDRLDADISFFRLRAGWLEFSGFQRLTAFSRLRSAEQFRWALPRVAGVGGLRAIRRFKSGLKQVRQ